jgi:hypothetical protein
MMAMDSRSDTGSCVAAAGKPSRSQQMVLDVLIAAHRNRLGPLTAGEIRERLELLHSPRRFDKGWVTGRLDELRDKDLVEQSEETRVSPVTKKASHLWFIPLRQARLCA